MTEIAADVLVYGATPGGIAAAIAAARDGARVLLLEPSRHVAFCTLRLESVWMITGQAAGVAAAMAAKQGVPVQALDVAQVQARLREGGQVIDFQPGQPEKCGELNGPPEF